MHSKRQSLPRTFTVPPHCRSHFCAAQSLLRCTVTFALHSHFCAVHSHFRAAQSLSRCTVTFALHSHFRAAQSLSRCTVTFALHSHFCAAQSLLRCTVTVALCTVTIDLYVHTDKVTLHFHDNFSRSWSHSGALQELPITASCIHTPSHVPG